MRLRFKPRHRPGAGHTLELLPRFPPIVHIAVVHILEDEPRREEGRPMAVVNHNRRDERPRWLSENIFTAFSLLRIGRSV
jgi:hypothetical protein